MIVIDGVEMVDVREAARLVGRTPETVRRWIWSGRLPASKRGNRLFIQRGDLPASSDAGAPRPGSLAEWAAQLPAGRRGARSASELVLDDRAAGKSRR